MKLNLSLKRGVSLASERPLGLSPVAWQLSDAFAGIADNYLQPGGTQQTETYWWCRAAAHSQQDVLRRAGKGLMGNKVFHSHRPSWPSLLQGAVSNFPSTLTQLLHSTWGHFNPSLASERLVLIPPPKRINNNCYGSAGSDTRTWIVAAASLCVTDHDTCSDRLSAKTGVSHL